MTNPPIPPSPQPPRPPQTPPGPGAGQTGGGTAPGWYPVGPGGQQRWWDGRQWGQVAGPVAPALVPLTVSDANLWAALSHACFFVLGIIGPAIIRATKGKIVTGSPQERYLRRQSTEALNFQISFLIAWFGGFIVLFLLAIGLGIVLAPLAGVVMVLMWLLLLAIWVGGLVCAIQGIMAGSKGQPYRYPVTFRFLND